MVVIILREYYYNSGININILGSETKTENAVWRKLIVHERLRITMAGCEG